VKAQSPLLGYNNNVSYKGCVYHVQTEDSGSRRPHVVTHLFAEGGRVVKSTKTSYEHLVGVADQNEQVRGLMKQQHKAMLVALREGFFDQLLGIEIPPASSQPAISTGGVAPDGAVTPSEPIVSGGPDSNAEPSHPVVSVDVLERAAAAAERDFFREIQVLAAAKESPAPVGTVDPNQPPSYRYVDTAYRAKGRTNEAGGARGAARTTARSHETVRDVPARTSEETNGELPEYETIPVPSSSAAGSNHLAPRRRFGDAFITDRRLDEVMVEFLTYRFEARG